MKSSLAAGSVKWELVGIKQVRHEAKRAAERQPLKIIS